MPAADACGAMNPAYTRAHEVAVESRGRLVAFLCARFGDVALVEDALSDAFVSALRQWPERGIPDRPEAWLLTVARNSLRDGVRRRAVRERMSVQLESAVEPATREGAFPDERLPLLFVCAHPAIDESARAPLMLQIVLGLNAERIAEAFLVKPAAMGQRLSRAKAKIAAAGIPFSIPEERELPNRLEAVLEAIYGAYGLGWDDLETGGGLSGEAIWLARTLTQLMPGAAEAHGLLALMLHSEARRPARTESGVFVPLSEQDTAKWDAAMQAEAEAALASASRTGGPIGPFQLEAAIQSAHASRARTGATPWAGIADLYDALARLRPSLGVLVGRAAAHGSAFGPKAGLGALEETAAIKGRFDYQPYWACRAALQSATGQQASAREACRRAMELTRSIAARRHLEKRFLQE